jgi:hypothetical protein
MNDYGDGTQTPAGDDADNRWFEEARARVRLPGKILQIFGIISVFLGTAQAVTALTSADALTDGYYNWIEDLQKNQPQQQRQKLPPKEEFAKSLQIEWTAAGCISIICSIFVFIGGSKMKELRGYGWAMAGSILAMIPCTNTCCCTSVPFGIWALVVLINADVKLAFAKTKAGAVG